MKKNLEKYCTKILWTEKQIQDKCIELGKWIDNEYKDSDGLVVIGLLKGCLPFFSDVLKRTSIALKVDFMRVSSYSGSTKSGGRIRIMLDVSMELHNKDVLIIDDIIDTGLTTSKITKMIKIKGPKSVKFMTLLNKIDNRQVKTKVDIFGFTSPNHFLVGYGLDYKGHFRQMPCIGIFNEKYLDEFN